MTAQVAIDNVPALARPSEVERAVADARKLRDRGREAAEQVAAAQQAVDVAEREDVESAAAAARAGQPVGAEGKAVEKARSALLAAQRSLNVVRLAQGHAEDDVATAIIEHAADWSVELAAEAERAREAGHASVAALADATRRLGGAGAATNWLAASVDDGRFDRPPRGVIAGSIAPSSRSRTANGEPLSATELLALVDELLDPPTPTPAPTIEATTTQA
jgi:hypothetical protein